jgi:NAD+ synthase (glutamine-hydrolysing)
MIRKVAMCQMNARVGDIRWNTQRIISGISEARQKGAQVVTFPELAVTGYPPEDLVYRGDFIRANMGVFKDIAAQTEGIAAVVGYIRLDEKSGKIFNSAVVLQDGKVVHIYDKMLLPNYSVFDERRYFTEGKNPSVCQLFGETVGVNICEDVWWGHGPTAAQAKAGAKLIFNINASPFYVAKFEDRFKMLYERAKQTRTTIFYNNLVGGQDELVFDGASMVVSPEGKLLTRGKHFEEDLVMVDLRNLSPLTFTTLPRYEEIYRAIKLSIADYYLKSQAGFTGAVIGLSGGIDSALTLCFAVDALGKDKVHAVYMPSKYSADMSREDAEMLAHNLGVDFMTVPIQSIFNNYLAELDPLFKGASVNVAEQNIQARIRGNFLMALSNKFGWLVFTTGNKSEMSVGYATLYGDMAGGFAVIKDVYKTDVFALARWRNGISDVIPERIITRPPSAELKEDQKDEDDLPSYSILDEILRAYIEKNLGVDEIVAMGFERETVERVMKMVASSEYKRRQGPPGPKITHRSFGKDWRQPICNGWNG